MAKPRPNMSWIGQTIGGRYQIESLLGQGGMSSVYKGIDPNLGRPVAIKLIHPHLSSDAEFVRRFDQEAKAVAQLRHPNIIQVYDFDHDGDVYYMVLEFVEGDTLQHKLHALGTANRRLPLADTTDIMAKICDAVAYAHQQGMIHRDLKPANVMLTPAGQPILMDFGVAKMVGGTSHTATGAIIGTAKYMSPEQARGERPDERTDIYSLGVMLYEMVAGKPPFDADTTVAVLMKHVTEPVPDIRQIRSDTPDALVSVIEKALAKQAANRYQKASEMAAALRRVDMYGEEETAILNRTQLATAVQQPEQAVTAAPQPTTPPPVAQPAKAGGRKNLWLVGAVAAVLVLVLGAAAVFLLSGSGDTAGTDEAQAVAASGQQLELPPSTGMVRIEGGAYTIGLDPSDNDHAPAQRVDIAEFWIDRYEVTNAQYAGFLADTGAEPPADWSGATPPAEQEKHPVQGVTWDQANAYCRWAGKRLPTEAEWEVAARGEEARLFPWGNDARAVTLPRSGTYEVGSKATNQTPSGLFDMAGNVWEWVDEPYAGVESGNQVLRGGANGFVKDMAYRLQGDPTSPTMFSAAGIRCAADRVEIVQAQTEVEEGVLYRDTFADPGSGWPVLAEDVRYFGYHPPDFYHIELSTPQKSTAITRPPAFEDVTVEADARVDHTDTENGNFRYGLVVRRTDEERYYAFVVSYRTATWQALKSSPAGLEVLAEGPVGTLQGFAPPGFTPDTSDSLRVDADGQNFAFYINGEAVTRVSDPDYTTGEVGFFVETFDETLTHVHYDSLVVRDLAAEVVAVAAPPATEEPEPPAPTQAAASDALPAAAVEELPTPTPASDTLLVPTDEPPPTSTPEPLPTPEPATPPPPAAPEGMILIPAGTFLMGSNSGQPGESPEHEVSLDAFFMDKFEVSNADYRRCVNDGGCTQTALPDAFTRPGYRDDPAFDNYPVVNVTWDQANAYCRWAGKRLPTEAEWEYAASGPDNLTWPWGNTFDVSLSAAGAPDTQPVDSNPGGASPFGVFNMAGNVNEWVQDTFDAGFYAVSPARNPVNNAGGSAKVFRGGSFANPDGAFYTTTRRYEKAASAGDVDIGFRCARDGS